MESPNKNRIYLVGFMGVGKSTIGKQLAHQLGYQFIDIDRVFEEKYKISISSFFDKYDEELFRKLEYEVLIDSIKLDKVVISTGGGTACFFDSIQIMNNNGLTVYLDMSEEELFKRLKSAKRKRPLVANKSSFDLKNTITEKLKERQPFYNQAHIVFKAIDINITELENTIKKY